MPKAIALACKHKVHDGAAFSIFAFGKDMKMERFRIGYDVTILWSVTDKKGVALPLTDKEVHLYYTCERGRFEADIEIQDDNVVVWHFLNKEQRVLGSYGLTLEVLQSDGKRAIRKDICEAFTLVGKSCFEETEGEANVLEGGEIVLASEIDIYRISPVIPQIGKNGNWWVDGQDTGRPASSTFVLDFTVKDIRDAIRDARGVIEKQTDKKAIVNALKSNALIVIPLGSYSEGYCLVQGEEDGAGSLFIEFDYSNSHYTAQIEEDRIEADSKDIAEGGSGLQYSVERTVYPTRLESAGYEPTDVEITEEERAYNIETYDMAWNRMEPVFVSYNGCHLNVIVMSDEMAVYNVVSHIDNMFDHDGLYSLTIAISKEGDAIFSSKPIHTGGASETPSDMNSDFSNDF